MRLNKEQKDMLRSYDKHTLAIGWVAWMAEPLVKSKFLKPEFIFDDEVYYGITRRGRAQLK